MNPDPRQQSEEDWRVSVSERITRLETKMNVIAGGIIVIAGISGTILVTIVMHFL